jgi:hypothetical protein
MEENWQKLSPEEKFEKRLASWLSPEGVEFVSKEAEAAYKGRVTRIVDAIQLKKTPDRVPVIPHVGFYPAYYAGFTPQEVMYDPDKAVAAWTKCVLDFEPDVKFSVNSALPGKVLEILDYRLYNWPGHGVSPNHGYQYVEGQYMKAEDYDALIQDPTDFWMRTYLPRIMGSLQPFALLSPLTNVVEIPMTPPNISRYGLPEMQAALEKLAEAGREALKWQRRLAEADKKLEELGFPRASRGMSKAPFDVIGDTLRGTREVMLDMFRRPGKLLEAIERVVPMMIRLGASGPTTGSPIVMMPLHKGADGFMSDEQFRTFYWPSLRQVILGLIEEGLVPELFAEGRYNTRLEVIRDLPKGKTIWHFDQTDIARAKEILGDVACIKGNVPLTLMQAGTPEAVTSYCRQLIATAGKGGGFILATGAGIEQGKAENLRAMIQCAKEYGVYR